MKQPHYLNCLLKMRLYDKVLRSKRYDDIYFPPKMVWLKTRHVFVNEQAYERAAEREHLLIAETGFGTGLNFLAVVAEVLL